MDDVTRRNAMKLAAVAGVAAVAGAAAKADEKKDHVASSGATASQPATAELTLDASKVKAIAIAGSFNSLFGRISPDARPGSNTLTITGLPAGTRVITVWMTEWAQGNQPHAGGAFFYTTSVQLFDNGTKCRVVFSMGGYNTNLPAAAQVIYGPA